MHTMFYLIFSWLPCFLLIFDSLNNEWRNDDMSLDVIFLWYKGHRVKWKDTLEWGQRTKTLLCILQVTPIYVGMNLIQKK